MSDESQQHAPLAHPEYSDTTDALRQASLEIARAQRQIERGVAELAEGMVALSLALLDIRRRRLYRHDPEFPTFEAHVAHRHGLRAEQATMYVEALLSLGEAQYRALLSDLGLQRTYALALLKQTDPALFTAFQALPAAERHAVTVGQIEAVDIARSQQLRVRIAQLEQDITREKGLLQQTRRRLQEVDELHQHVTGTLIDERDSARQALEQEQRQVDQLRRLLAEARAPHAGAGSPNTAPARTHQPATPAAEAAPAIAEAVVIVMGCDVVALTDDIQSLHTKLQRLATEQLAGLPVEETRPLLRALARLEPTIATLLAARSEDNDAITNPT
jgi:hypothetical protein